MGTRIVRKERITVAAAVASSLVLFRHSRHARLPAQRSSNATRRIFTPIPTLAIGVNQVGGLVKLPAVPTAKCGEKGMQ